MVTIRVQGVPILTIQFDTRWFSTIDNHEVCTRNHLAGYSIRHIIPTAITPVSALRLKADNLEFITQPCSIGFPTDSCSTVISHLFVIVIILVKLIEGLTNQAAIMPSHSCIALQGPHRKPCIFLNFAKRIAKPVGLA